MNRQLFEEILSMTIVPEGTTAENVLEILMPLSRACIQLIPERLFKYRNCCDNHISAFRGDQIWMSTSDLFNDPYDTLIQYDDEELKSAADALSDPQVFQKLSQFIADGGNMAKPLDSIVDDKEKARLRQSVKLSLDKADSLFPGDQSLANVFAYLDQCIKSLPETVQRFCTSACFSEHVDSLLMWSHYSDSHKGFAIGYDLRSLLLPNKEKFGLYPVIYSSKRYNAKTLLYYYLCKLLQIPAHNPDTTNFIKLLLYKSKDWEYESEWRIIGDGDGSYQSKYKYPITLVPNSIYYGAKISDESFNKLHKIALQKGIEEYRMAVENNSSEYRMKVTQLQ